MQNNKIHDTSSANGTGVNRPINPPLARQVICLIEQASSEQSIVFSHPSSWLYVLVVPPLFEYSRDEARQVAHELMSTVLAKQENNTRRMLLDVCDMETRACDAHKSCGNWLKPYQEKFFQGLHLMFLVEVNEASRLIKHVAAAQGLSIGSKDGNKLAISKGKFGQEIEIEELVLSTLWRGEKLEKQIDQQLAKCKRRIEFHPTLLKMLIEQFRNETFIISDQKIYVKGKEKSGCIDNKMIDSILDGKLLPCDLKHLILDDLLFRKGRPVISVRSPVYARAWPNSLFRSKSGYLLACEWEANHRLIPIEASGDQNQHQWRSEHYFTQSHISRSSLHFKTRVICFPTLKPFGISLIGHQIASLATDPRLIASVVRQFGKHPDSVRLLSSYEDMLTIIDSNASWQDVFELERRALAYYQMTRGDGADPLELDLQMQLSDDPCGTIEVERVPEEFFELLDVSEHPETLLAPGRQDYVKGLAFELIHENELALIFFRKAAAMDTNALEYRYAFGRLLIRCKRYIRAIYYLQRMLQKHPNDPEIVNSLGLAYLGNNDSRKAIRLFEFVSKLCPNEVHYLLNLGKGYFEDGNAESAAKTLNQALKILPELPEAHAMLAEIRFSQGQKPEAKSHAQTAYSMDPSNENIRRIFFRIHEMGILE